MDRIPTHSVDDAPAKSRPLLEAVVRFSPTGHPLNLHARMAHSPAVLAAYTSIRKAAAEHGTLGQRDSAALMSGWDVEQLTEAFVYIGLTVFTAYFLNYAQTPVDVPTGVPAT
jgi:hypothetical protein